MKRNGQERKRVFGRDPLYGSRRIRDLLHREGYKVNRKKVQRLMHLMGISALYPKRRTSLAEQGHRTQSDEVGLELAAALKAIEDVLMAALKGAHQGGTEASKDGLVTCLRYVSEAYVAN